LSIAFNYYILSTNRKLNMFVYSFILDLSDGLQFPCINTAVTGKPYSFLYAGGYGESKCLEFAVSIGTALCTIQCVL